MTYRIGVLLIVTMIVLGGCQMGENEEAKIPSEMKEEDLPDVPAFNDELTRDFLQSTEETEEGFYPFLSKTEKYKMDFPAGGVIDDRSYLVKESDHEEIHISIEDETGFGMDVIYFPNHTEKQLEGNLDRFKSRLSYDGDLKELDRDDRTIFYNHYESNGFRNYVGYILNKQGKGGIEIDYEIDCRDEKEKICKKDKEKDNERAMNWMESVQFINENGSDD